MYSFYEMARAAFGPETQFVRSRIERAWSTLREYVRGVVLDLCCGGGGFSFAVGERLADRVIGLDIYPPLLHDALAYRRSARVGFVAGDARSLPFRDEYFDSVLLMGNTLAHFSIEEGSTMLQEVRRVLKQNGVFIVEHQDPVVALLEGEYSRVTYENWVGALTVHEKYEALSGYFVKRYSKGAQNVRIRLYLWPLFLLIHLSQRCGLRLVECRWIAKSEALLIFTK